MGKFHGLAPTAIRQQVWLAAPTSLEQALAHAEQVEAVLEEGSQDRAMKRVCGATGEGSGSIVVRFFDDATKSVQSRFWQLAQGRPGLTIWHMRIAAGRGQQSPMIRLSVMAMTRRVLGARASKHLKLSAWCSVLQHSALLLHGTLRHTTCCTLSGFHRCVTCGTKLPVNDPHEDCVSCLGPEHAASALADKAFCTSCASFQTHTLRRRARRAVRDCSPSSGSSLILSAPQPSLASLPPKLPISRSSSSQVTAGQRSPDARRKRDRSHSPPVMRGPSPRGERPQISRSRSGSPRRRGRSRSPRRDRRGGVTELTNKMSQFMDLMMGQQSLLMSLVTARAAEEPGRPVVNQPIILPQPLSVPVAQQDAWDVDAISRDASEVERATRHLGLEWPATEEPRRSLFESPLAQGQQSRTLPAFPDFVKEVQSTWGTPASTPATSHKAAAFTMQGASEAGLASFPPVGAAFAALVKSPTLSGLVKDPTCPNKQCRITEVHLKRGYSAATEAVRLSNLASLLSVYQAALIKDLPDYPSVSLRAELGLIAQLLVKLAQLNARAQGRSIASLVVARRQLWLSQARVQEHDKAPLLDAPITPGHTFGPAVEEMLQRSAKAKEASQQLATIWPRRPFQVKRPQEHQWRRTPPQHQPRPGGTKTFPASTAARGQIPIGRPQRTGWRPRGGGRPRPRGAGQAPRERAQPKQP
ncbi:UNVERIFIED_CONTAM: hypothetical protein FKN15_046826 [Acipenser sinensis]